MSVHGHEAIVDGGYKAFATDRPFPPTPLGALGLTYSWAGDEHGRLDMREALRRLRVGDRVTLQPPHCDPTVNLYDEIHARAGRHRRGGLADRGAGQEPVARPGRAPLRGC